MNEKGKCNDIYNPFRSNDGNEWNVVSNSARRKVERRTTIYDEWQDSSVHDYYCI